MNFLHVLMLEKLVVELIFIQVLQNLAGFMSCIKDLEDKNPQKFCLFFAGKMRGFVCTSRLTKHTRPNKDRTMATMFHSMIHHVS